MTGFGSASGVVGNSAVQLELRTVNHRFFTPSIKLPGALSRWEVDVRELLRQRIARGHVTLFGRMEREHGQAPSIDPAKFREHVLALRELQKEYGLGELSVDTILRMPDVVVTSSAELSQDAGAELLVIVDGAIASLTAMREAEGARLAAVLVQRMDVVSETIERLARRAPARLVEQRDKVRRTVRDLADGVAVDEQRLAQEIAFLADRLDVHEELDRLSAHVQAFGGSVTGSGDEPVGKRLGFVLQEMQREANTIGSKASDVAMQRDVIGLKEEMERLREQVENIE
jgi:uncharacterized protein (TIGR00255 family)